MKRVLHEFAKRVENEKKIENSAHYLGPRLVHLCRVTQKLVQSSASSRYYAPPLLVHSIIREKSNIRSRNHHYPMPKPPPLDQLLIILIPLTVKIAAVHELTNPKLGSH